MDHYFTKKPESTLSIIEIEDTLLGNNLKFLTASGVFSFRKVDKGSKLLIENAKLKEGLSILDMACGYGIVGISIAKKYPGSTIVMSDVNERAIMLTKKNIKKAKLENVSVVLGNLFEKVIGKFDTILINPPQKAGKKICFEMISESYGYLKTGGTLQIVARHQKGGKELQKRMDEIFGNSDSLAKGGGFRVYLSERKE